MNSILYLAGDAFWMSLSKDQIDIEIQDVMKEYLSSRNLVDPFNPDVTPVSAFGATRASWAGYDGHYRQLMNLVRNFRPEYRSLKEVKGERGSARRWHFRTLSERWMLRIYSSLG